ncbi:hypothetical protein GCM10022223_15270 [Kineosporia mesophila]|uniref:AB hydrolase-1 domain-containing protein n=1 Tax=Kineosporia mesophila TaxID=566012 RepID=A0ABP6ZBK3_9ACTN|nr:alpha/beta fold hydrolase [Kineosporia mesophila]
MRTTVVADDAHRIGCEIHGSGDAPVTVVFLPALGVPLGYYAPLFEAWVRRGRQVVGVENRGQPLSPATGRFGYSDMIRRDLPAVFGLSPVQEASRVVLAGHSMGGALALLGTAAQVVEPRAVVTIATGTSWCAAEFGPWRRARRHAGTSVVRAVTRGLGYWPGHRLGFAGRQPATVMRDWAHEAHHGTFRLHGDRYDYEAALARMSTPRLMLGIDGDPLINPRAVALLARRAGGAERRQIRVDHPGDDHFRWVRHTPGPVIAGIDAWLDRM